MGLRACVCVGAHANVWHEHSASPAEAPLPLLCGDTWQRATEQLEQRHGSAHAANGNRIAYSELVFSVLESSLLIQIKYTSISWHTLTLWGQKSKNTKLPLPHCDLPHSKRRRKVITNLLSLWLDACVRVQCAAQLAITQHHGELIYLSRLPALLNPPIASTCNFRNPPPHSSFFRRQRQRALNAKTVFICNLCFYSDYRTCMLPFPLVLTIWISGFFFKANTMDIV